MLARRVVEVEDASGPPKGSPGTVGRRRGVGCETSVWKTERKTLLLRARTRDAVMVAASSSHELLKVSSAGVSRITREKMSTKKDDEICPCQCFSDCFWYLIN